MGLEGCRGVGGGVGGVVKTRYNANLSSTATAVGIATGTELGNIVPLC